MVEKGTPADTEPLLKTTDREQQIIRHAVEKRRRAEQKRRRSQFWIRLADFGGATVTLLGGALALLNPAGGFLVAVAAVAAFVSAAFWITAALIAKVTNLTAGATHLKGKRLTPEEEDDLTFWKILKDKVKRNWYTIREFFRDGVLIGIGSMSVELAHKLKTSENLNLLAGIFAAIAIASTAAFWMPAYAVTWFLAECRGFYEDYQVRRNLGQTRWEAFIHTMGSPRSFTIAAATALIFFSAFITSGTAVALGLLLSGIAFTISATANLYKHFFGKPMQTHLGRGRDESPEPFNSIFFDPEFSGPTVSPASSFGLTGSLAPSDDSSLDDLPAPRRAAIPPSPTLSEADLTQGKSVQTSSFELFKEAARAKKQQQTPTPASTETPSRNRSPRGQKKNDEPQKGLLARWFTKE